jgi:hypothetical protein
MVKPQINASGLVRDLVHNQREHEEAERRAAERCPDSGPVRICCQCGEFTRFNRIDRTLTSQDWCAMCYGLAVDQEGQRAKFLGQRSGIARHLVQSQKPKSATTFELEQYGFL